MGDRLLGKDVIEESEIRLVGVRGRAVFWDERWGAADAIELMDKGSKTDRGEGWILPVEGVWGWIGQTESVLNV